MAAQLDLAGGTTAKLVEYEYQGELWRCSQFDLLAAEFPPILTEQVGLLHGVVCTQERTWLIVRRLFGLQPVITPKAYNMDDCRVWERDELREKLGLTRPQLKAELEAARGMWEGVRPKAASLVRSPEAPREHKEELSFNDDELLKKYGITLRLPDMVDREWFASRVRDWERVLAEKQVRQLGMSILMTELQIRQMDAVLATKNAGGTEWRANYNIRSDMSKDYNEQLKLLNTLAPWASSLTGKQGLIGVMSEVTKGIQDYVARQDTRLVDGMFTAMGLRVELRRNVQMPTPRYRAGLVVFVNAARAGIWDTNWESPFANAELKKLDAAWAAAMSSASDQAGEPVIDLEREDAEGEYPSLAQVAEQVAKEQGGI